MSPSRQQLAVALVLMVLSGCWLLGQLEILPSIQWGAMLAIGGLGLLTLAVGAIDRQTFVMGFFLLIASMVSVLRHTGHLNADLALPALMASLALLLLVGQIIPTAPQPWKTDRRTTRVELPRSKAPNAAVGERV